MCHRMLQIAPYLFQKILGGGGGGGGGGRHVPGPPSMALENTSCFKYDEKDLYFVRC